MFEISKRTTVLQTPWFALRAKTIGDGGETYYAVEGPDYVCVLALTDERQIVLVRQFRPAVEEFTLELPSGLVDDGEKPQLTAARELNEETGYRVRSLELMGELRPDTGRLENRLWCFFARVEHERDEPRIESGELGLQTLTMPLDEFLATCGREGGCIHALNLAPVALALLQGRLK
ncbi:MAG: NUDIX hydrolase [Vulcanimicrobiaceae bacterium]